MTTHLNMNDTRPDQAQQIVTLSDYAIKLQDKNNKKVKSISKLRDEVRELQKQLHHANITIQCQREKYIYERKAWMAFSRRNCCDRYSVIFSKFVKNQLQVDLVDRVIFREIKNFLGFVGVEAGIEDSHTLYAVFYVLFNYSNPGYIKWNLKETLLLGNVSWEQQETLHKKADAANNVIPVAY